MNRGDLVLCADKSGEFTSKPRPVLVLQNSLYIDAKETVIVCPVSSAALDVPLALVLQPTLENGLKLTSVIRLDLITTVRKVRLGKKLGVVSPVEVMRINEILRDWLNL